MPLPVETNAALDLYFMIMSFCFGAVVGSFCNVCICRWPAGESVVKPRSRCPKCKKEIAWYDNIPIFSWIILGAKCRNCSLPIRWRYPAVEALTGVLFLLVYLRFGMTVASPIYMIIAASMVVVTFQDLDDWTIPNEITLPGIPLGFALAVAAFFLGENWGLRVNDPLDALFGILLGAGILYRLALITVWVLKKPGMGFGDVKLLAMLGAFIGWKGVLGTIMFASFLGSGIGIATILYYRIRGVTAPAPPDDENGNADEEGEGEEPGTLQGNYLPFGPFLALGGLVFLFYGPEIIEAYMTMMGRPAPSEFISIL